MKNKIVLLAAACIANASPAQAGQNLLFNGSFEQPAYTGDYYTYSSDFGFTLPGWTYPPGYNKFFLEYGHPPC